MRTPYATLCALVLLASLPSAAFAGRSDDPDVEIAQRRFMGATVFYQKGDYAHALREFRAAQEVKPLPEFDYNIARCLDRLERYTEALVNYERYLEERPNAIDGVAVRERIVVLQGRVVKHAPAQVIIPVVSKAKLEGTRWTVTSSDHHSQTFDFLGKGRLSVRTSTRIKGAKRCTWRQAGQELVTACGSEGVTWLVNADRMFGQSAEQGFSAQLSR